MTDIHDIVDVQVRYAPTTNLLRVTEDADGCPVLSVPIEIATVVRHLLQEGFVTPTKRFTLTHEGHAPLMPVSDDGPS